MQKYILLLMCLVFIAPISAQDESDGIEAWTCPEGFSGQSLRVYNWSTYIADNTIANFEILCDVDVSYTIFETDDAVYDEIRFGNNSEYDVVIPGGAILAQMISEDLVMPLDLTRIPNRSNISPELLNPPYDDGNQFSLPYQWGTIAIGYNTNIFPDGIESWEEVFTYEGSVGWLDDSRALLGTALVMLGYDPNSTTTAEIIEARNYLGNHAGTNLTIYPDSEGQEALANGDVDIIIEYSGDIIDLTYECECDDFAYTIPAEGANIWVDSMAIPVGARNPDLAHVFIDYILHPEINAEISNFTAYGSPNQTAIENGLIDQELLDNPGIYPSDDVREGLYFVLALGSDVNRVYMSSWQDILLYVENLGE